MKELKVFFYKSLIKQLYFDAVFLRRLKQKRYCSHILFMDFGIIVFNSLKQLPGAILWKCVMKKFARL